MELHFSESNGIVYGKFKGRLDTMAAQNTDISDFLSNADKKIVFDCSNLEFISSAGLRLLLALFKESRSKGGSITLKSMNPIVMRTFQISGFVNMFSFE